jgi:hypothetical protein
MTESSKSIKEEAKRRKSKSNKFLMEKMARYLGYDKRD